MLEVALFIAMQWLMGRTFKQFGAPSILAEILTGVLLGPELANIVPYAESHTPYSCYEDLLGDVDDGHRFLSSSELECSDEKPSMFVLIGNVRGGKLCGAAR
jgi:Kef-type K+ transport system membrane component KefB